MNKQNNIKVRVGTIDAVDVFTVKESELDRLENGENTDLFLNFSIFLISLAVSALFTLVSATFKKPVFQILTLIILVIGTLGGGLLLLLWKRSRKYIKGICKTIRERNIPKVKEEDQAVTPEPISDLLNPVVAEVTNPKG